MKLAISCFDTHSSTGFVEEVILPQNSILSTPELAGVSLRSMYENAVDGLEVVGITEVIEVERGCY